MAAELRGRSWQFEEPEVIRLFYWLDGCPAEGKGEKKPRKKRGFLQKP